MCDYELPKLGILCKFKWEHLGICSVSTVKNQYGQDLVLNLKIYIFFFVYLIFVFGRVVNNRHILYSILHQSVSESNGLKNCPIQLLFPLANGLALWQSELVSQKWILIVLLQHLLTYALCFSIFANTFSYLINVI